MIANISVSHMCRCVAFISYWDRNCKIQRTIHLSEWIGHTMMTSSNGNIFRVTGGGGLHLSPVNSPHKGQCRGALIFPLIRALNKRMSKQHWGWWFETPLHLLWRQCNAHLVDRFPFPKTFPKRYYHRQLNSNVIIDFWFRDAAIPNEM